MINKNKKGQAIVEMALVLPIFLFVLIGIVDFGRVLHTWSNLNYQCVQAARAATKRINPLVARNAFTSTTHTNLADVQEVFWNYRSPLMPKDQFSNLTFSGIGTSDQTVTVKSSFQLNLYTPVLGALIGGENGEQGIRVGAEAQERKE